MSTEESREVMRAFIEDVWNGNSPDLLDDLLSGDGVHRTGNLPRPFTRETVQATMDAWRAAAPDFRFMLEELVAEDDKVVAKLRMVGTHTGPLAIGERVIPASGRSFDEPEILFFRVRDRKVVESWAVWDELSMIRAVEPS